MNKQINIEIGTKFSCWEYLGESRIVSKKLQILCKCNCGNELYVTYENIKNGRSTKCRDCAGIGKKDLTGQKFGRLKVIEEAGKDKYNKYLWRCVCDCGNEKIISTGDLRSEHTRSCGCLWKEMRDNGLLPRNTTHDMTNTKIYRAWRAMLNRCNLTTHQAYVNYGGRGIKVCERWSDKKTGFLNFLEDMGEPLEGYSIDRIDVNGNYEPGNCQWIPKPDQNKNMRTTYKIELDGKIMCLADVCRYLNLPYAKIINRVKRLKWDLKRALELE